VKRIPVRRAALVAAALVLSSLVPGFAVPPAGAADPGVAVTGSVHDLAGATIAGPVELLDGQGDYVAGASNTDAGFAFQAPAGHYTLHLETAVPGYADGFRTGDEQAPGLFVDLPVDFAGDARFDLTVPIVDFPVHVVGHDGDPAAGETLAGDSAGPVELAPGAVGTATLKNNRQSTDADGDGTLQILRGAPPATVSVTDGYETLGRVSVAPDATSAVVTLDNPVIQGGLADGRGPLPAAALDGAWVAFAATAQPGGQAPWPYFVGPEPHYRLQGDPGDRRLYVSDRNPWGSPDAVAPPASATLPGWWSFAAPYHLGGDATVDLTLPDAAPADVVVLDGSGQPVSGTMHYSAVAQNPVELAPGVDATATAADDIADAGGHFVPMLFGPSAFTFSIDDSAPSDPITLNPGQPITLHLADQSGVPGAPGNVAATAGDGKVKVTWDAPASDGGSPITGYTVTASHGGSNFRANFGAGVTSGAIRGLVNGKTYSVIVLASNANGAGPASDPVTVTLDAVAPPTTTTTAPGSGGARNGGGGLAGAGSGDDGGQGAAPGPGSGRSGYWLLGADGAVYPFGDAAPQGDASASLAGSGTRAVDLEPTPSGQGYWILDSAGRVHPFGDAPHFGDVVPARLAPGEVPASLSATPTGAGYWVFTNRGRVIPFGDAPFLGDMSAAVLNGPVLDSVATPSGRGYYLVAADGGIFAFGDARFAGSMGGRALNAPVRSLVPDGDGSGYWLVASDGGVFAFDAPFRGSMGGRTLNGPVQGMVRYGDGYVMVGGDGGVFAFSDRPFSGSLGARPPASPVVAVAALG
jgi:hypothetical protein